MTYYDGMILPLPQANEGAYRKHASDAAPLFQELGVTRIVENLGNDVPDGKVTDFKRAVNAEPGENVVFSWFEYPSKEVRDQAHAKMMDDPRMKEMGATMPFDGKRMIMAGFETLVEEGQAGDGGYTDGFVVPVPDGKRDAYRALAQKSAGIFREYGANHVVEAWGDDIPDGKVTDFKRAVKAEPNEGIVFSFIQWPDKTIRDEAWKKIMEDERMKPEGEMPFAGQRMFWGGFEPIVDTAKAQLTHA
jgi:uncharacterized protein YbaA (DUF1428 family)